MNKLGRETGKETYVCFRISEQKMSDIYSSLWEFHMITYREGAKNVVDVKKQVLVHGQLTE